MTDLFLLVLGVAWLLVLWPAAVRARRNTPLSTATRFKRKMRLIAPKAARAGRWILAPQSSSATGPPTRGTHAHRQRQRKHAFVVLLVAVPLTAVAAALWGADAWLVHAAADVALIGYVGFLLAAKRRRSAAEGVRAVSRRRPVPEVDFTEPAYEQRQA